MYYQTFSQSWNFFGDEGFFFSSLKNNSNYHSQFESNWTGSIQPGPKCNMTILQIVIENLS
jgi:hypothetical protein